MLTERSYSVHREAIGRMITVTAALGRARPTTATTSGQFGVAVRSRRRTLPRKPLESPIPLVVNEFRRHAQRASTDADGALTIHRTKTAPWFLHG